MDYKNSLIVGIYSLVFDSKGWLIPRNDKIEPSITLVGLKDHHESGDCDFYIFVYDQDYQKVEIF